MPAVLSGPRSRVHGTNGTNDAPKSIFELMAEKDDIEAEISALNDVLVSVRTSVSQFPPRLAECL